MTTMTTLSPDPISGLALADILREQRERSGYHATLECVLKEASENGVTYEQSMTPEHKALHRQRVARILAAESVEAGMWKAEARWRSEAMPEYHDHGDHGDHGITVNLAYATTPAGMNTILRSIAEFLKEGDVTIRPARRVGA